MSEHTFEHEQMKQLRYVFYGAGAMAEAIVRGILERQLALPQHITMLNRSNAARLEALGIQYGVHVTSDPKERLNLLREADVVVLAVKPKDAAEALRTLAPLLHDGQLLVSVIAGLSLYTMQRLLQAPRMLVRTMPNTSSMIGLGATGISFSDTVTADWKTRTIAIFEAFSKVAVVDEPLLDSITALSGSGPAYIYYMMEAMIAGGEALGLAPEAARELTLQTVLGAAQMAITTGESPGELRRKVTSPNGTTQAAIETMATGQFTDTVTRAMQRAAQRAGEFGAMIEKEC